MNGERCRRSLIDPKKSPDFPAFAKRFFLRTMLAFLGSLGPKTLSELAFSFLN